MHISIMDALDDRAEDAVDRSLLAALEVARGEISDAYRLVREHPDQTLPEEFSVFFDALDIGTDLLAVHLRCVPAQPQSRDGMPRATRSKYSGSLEGYPIDIRTCAINDVRRYFPGQSIAIPSASYRLPTTSLLIS